MGQFVLLCYCTKMIFKQLFDTKSSTYTYLISSGEGREALLIDPVIENVSEYINLLKKLDLKLVKVIDTHIHADHVTGVYIALIFRLSRLIYSSSFTLISTASAGVCAPIIVEHLVISLSLDAPVT